MAKNRLDLNFNLETTEQRNQFVQQYIQKEEFKQKPLTTAELETISNYILWGKECDGKNVVQKKEIDIKTRNSTWAKKEIESIEELMENPAFDENLMIPIGVDPPIKRSREVFNREKALQDENLRNEYLSLFRQIDEADLLINYYDLEHGKRKNPPRQELLDRFTEEEQERIRQRATTLDSYNYLKWRHLLVELRSSQFSLKNCGFSGAPRQETRYHIRTAEMVLDFSENITIFPLGMFSDNFIGNSIFTTEADLENKHFSDSELKRISNFFWSQNSINKNELDRYFDFTNPEHVYQLLLQYPDLDNEESTGAKDLLKTINYYIEQAKLSNIHSDLLEMKLLQRKNMEIAIFLNEKYGKSYTENYISTLYKKNVDQIVDAALFHKDLIENIFFPENFRKCTRCGNYLLKHPRNFVRKTRAADGFCGRCKSCDKEVRQRKKEMKKNDGR